MRKNTLTQTVLIAASSSLLLVGQLAYATADVGERAAAACSIRTVDVPDARWDSEGEVLQRRVEEASFEEAPLDVVFDWVQGMTEANVIVRWQVLEDSGVARDKPISLSVRNLKLHQMLWMILQEAGGRDVDLAYEVLGDDLIVISTASDLEREMVVRIYDVHALLTSQDPPADGQAHAGSGEERLESLIVTTVEPDSWAANGGSGTHCYFNAMLVIQQSRSVHRQVEALLNALLEARGAGAER